MLLRQRTGLFVPSPPRLSELIPSANAGNMTATSQGSHSSTSGGVGTSNGVVGAGPEGSSEEERVALLRSALGRVRLEEDRAVRAEIRLALMSIAEPSSAMPVSDGVARRRVLSRPALILYGRSIYIFTSWSDRLLVLTCFFFTIKVHVFSSSAFTSFKCVCSADAFTSSLMIKENNSVSYDWVALTRVTRVGLVQRIHRNGIFRLKPKCLR